MPQRVGFVTYALHGGGMETFLLRLCRLLQQTGFDVEVLTTEARGVWFDTARRQGCNVVDLGEPDGTRWLEPLRHAAHIGEYLRDAGFDVVFLNHARYAQSSLGLVPERTAAIPILHNDAADIYRVGLANQSAWNVAVGVSPKVTSIAKTIVPHKPVVTIPHGIEMPETATFARRSAFEPPLRVLYLGRLEHRQKGVLHLPAILKAVITRHCCVQMRIVGDGSDAFELKRSFEECGLSSQVDFAGSVPPEQAYAELLDAHILLMPSYYEGLPITLLEAQACGCVPVVSFLPGITDFAAKQQVSGILVSPGDVQAFADAIVKLTRSAQLWETMSAAGRAHAEEHFSLDRMGQAYIDLIEDARRGVYPLRRSSQGAFHFDTELFRWTEYAPVRLRRRVKAILHR